MPEFGSTLDSSSSHQLPLRLRPDLELVDLRGNAPTRVNRVCEGKYDAIMLARAGLVRLALPLDDLFVKPLDVEEFVPPPAQGMHLYAGYDADGNLAGVALEAAAQGYQDVIRVLYSYDPSCECIRGMEGLKMAETPGIGDNIAKDPFFL